MCSLTCQNGGVPSDSCSVCNCAPGFSGPTCQTNVNDCDPNPCENGGTCQDEINSFTCLCATNSIGRTCQGNTSFEVIKNDRNSQPQKGKLWGMQYDLPVTYACII